MNYKIFTYLENGFVKKIQFHFFYFIIIVKVKRNLELYREYSIKKDYICVKFKGHKFETFEK